MAPPIIGIFGIRNDKQRGLLIETLKIKDEYFFKYQDQPVDRHCQQMQNILASHNIKRSKKISVDITPFLTEYYRSDLDTIMFKGTGLNSSNKQMECATQMAINRKIGVLKRKKTMAAKEQTKMTEENEKKKTKLAKDEALFQVQRAMEICELFEERERQNTEEHDGEQHRMEINSMDS